MCGQQLHTPLPISTEPFASFFFTIPSVLLCKPKETLSWILESHHVMTYPPEHLVCEKSLSSVMTCSLLHLVLRNAKQTKCAYVDWNHQSVISLLSFGDVFFSSSLSLLQGNLQRNYLSLYFLMSLQLAKCLDALFQLFFFTRYYTNLHMQSRVVIPHLVSALPENNRRPETRAPQYHMHI